MAKAFKLNWKMAPQHMDEVAYLLRLMMSIDAMQSAIRWWEHLEKEDTVVAHTDRQMSMLTMMGWAGETLRTIKQGENAGFVGRDTLKGQPRLLEIWDEAFGSSQPSVIKKIHRARDKCFAHWDRDIAKAFVEHQATNGYDIPFIETDEDGKFRRNLFPWVYMAIWHDIAGPEINQDELPKLLNRIGQVVASVSGMANEMAWTIFNRMRLEHEEADLKGS